MDGAPKEKPPVNAEGLAEVDGVKDVEESDFKLSVLGIPKEIAGAAVDVSFLSSLAFTKVVSRAAAAGAEVTPNENPEKAAFESNFGTAAAAAAGAALSASLSVEAGFGTPNEKDVAGVGTGAAVVEAAGTTPNVKPPVVVGAEAAVLGAADEEENAAGTAAEDDGAELVDAAAESGKDDPQDSHLVAFLSFITKHTWHFFSLGLGFMFQIFVTGAGVGAADGADAVAGKADPHDSHLVAALSFITKHT